MLAFSNENFSERWNSSIDRITNQKVENEVAGDDYNNSDNRHTATPMKVKLQAWYQESISEAANNSEHEGD